MKPREFEVTHGDGKGSGDESPVHLRLRASTVKFRARGYEVADLGGSSLVLHEHIGITRRVETHAPKNTNAAERLRELNAG